MNDETPATLAALVQGQLDADTAFTAALDGLSEEEKATKIGEKRAELTEAAFAKQREIAENQRIRAEKAEKGGKDVPPAQPPPPTPSTDQPALSATDLYALTQAKVHLDDINDVQTAAKALNLPLGEALKHEVVLTMLEKRNEARASAEAANTGAARSGAQDATDDEILANAEKGIFPAAGTKEADRLFWLRRGGKPQQR